MTLLALFAIIWANHSILDIKSMMIDPMLAKYVDENSVCSQHNVGKIGMLAKASKSKERVLDYY